MAYRKRGKRHVGSTRTNTRVKQPTHPWRAAPMIKGYPPREISQPHVAHHLKIAHTLDRQGRRIDPGGERGIR